MRPKHILMILLGYLALSGCSSLRPDPEPLPDVILQPYTIVEPADPRPLDFLEVKWKVVTPSTINQYLAEIGDPGDYVFYGMTVGHYGNLALNMDEIRRYIKQQQAIINYYKESVKTQNESTKLD